MENRYDNYFYGKKDFAVNNIEVDNLINEPLTKTVDEPVVDVTKEVESEIKKEEVRPKKKSSKSDKVVYAIKEVWINGFIVPKGYSRVPEDMVENVIKHPKVRLATQKEIDTYL